MGIDCKGVYRTIHFRPSKNVESYIRESGRAGRDGGQSTSFILCQGLLLNHVDKDMKKYLATDGCRKIYLLSNFDLSSDIKTQSPLHLCCENCARQFSCTSSECGVLTKFPSNTEKEAPATDNVVVESVLVERSVA